MKCVYNRPKPVMRRVYKRIYAKNEVHKVRILFYKVFHVFKNVLPGSIRF